MKELDKEVIQKAIINAGLKVINETRVNFSKQADEIVERFKKGEKLTELDNFILLTNDENKIAEFTAYYNIKDRISKGRLTHEDVDYLVSRLGNVEEIDKAMKNAFYIRGDQSNLIYAQAHPDEFTPEEIEQMKQNIREGKTIKESLEQDLVR